VNQGLFSTSPAVSPPQFRGVDFTQLSSGRTRVIGHILITVMIWISSILGKSAMVDMSKRSLRMGKAVRVSHLAGWRTPGEAIMWVFGTRDLPGGFWFTPMIVTALVGIFANLSVAAFTTDMAVYGVCGGPIDIATANASIGWSDAESPLMPLFADALQTQLYSMANGGLPGVYRAAPVQSSFRATDLDVSCAWNCLPTWTKTRTLLTNSPYKEMSSLLGTTANASIACHVNTNAVYTSCAIVGTNFHDPFNLRLLFGIDVPLPNNVFPSTAGSPIPVNGYNCTLHTTSTCQWVQGRVEGLYLTESLSMTVAPRAVYDSKVMTVVVELMSNAMLATNGYATSDSAIYTYGAEYGCVTKGTRVQLPACVLVGACVVTVLIWGLIAGVARALAHGDQFLVPVGLMDWMDQAIRGAGASDIPYDSQITPARRRDWAMAINKEVGGGVPRLGLVDSRQSRIGPARGKMIEEDSFRRLSSPEVPPLAEKDIWEI